jgi:DNA-binding GntR family transcriptional regulator
MASKVKLPGVVTLRAAKPASGSARGAALDEPDVRPDAYERLRAAILLGTLEAGRVYPQAALSSLLDVGRTPLREAIRRLQAEGWLDANKNRRVRIAPLDPGDLQQLYAARISLETLCVRLSVPRLTDEDVVFLERALDGIVAANERADIVSVWEPHRDFHLRLIEHAGARLFRQVQELWDHAERYRRLFFKSPSEQRALQALGNAEHTEIFEAAARRDGLACSEILARHLGRTGLTILAGLDSRVDPSDVRAALHMVAGRAK